MSETTTQYEAGEERQYRFGGYLWLVFAVAIAGYLLPIAVERVPRIESHIGSSFAPALEYAYQTNGEDADVVIFGDSAAMIDLDPVAISHSLGMKVINLPNTGSSLPIVGENMLRHYLAHNKPPRLIVLYLSVGDLNYSHQAAIPKVYEGEEMLASHGTLADLAAFGRKRPLDLMLFPLRFYSVAPMTGLQSVILHNATTADIRTAQGRFDPMLHHGSLTSEPCSLGAPAAYPMTAAQEFLARYATAQTSVMAYLSPIPDCVDAAKVTGQSFAAISADPPLVMPRGDFKYDPTLAHLQPPAVPEATAHLTEAIRHKLGM